MTLRMALFVTLALAACTPKVALEAPKEPIHLIVDVNVKHELYVKLDKDAEKLIEENEDIF